MVEYYPWLVFVHLVGVVLFAAAHGVSMWAAFRIREDRDPAIVASHLESSKAATRAMYVALLLLAIGGLGAAWVAGFLVARWVIASYAVLGVVLVVMWAVAMPYYGRLRQAVADGREGVDAAALDRLLDSRRPDLLMAVGMIGLVVLIWLMVLKPG